MLMNYTALLNVSMRVSRVSPAPLILFYETVFILIVYCQSAFARTQFPKPLICESMGSPHFGAYTLSLIANLLLCKDGHL
ncbi:hypothetical protein M405DRAFT_806281 [Rhizopogon salebrosus TDB-379]|nr:hypothetical protein M405DRAFT_806281 [Rhizopogon salebrosus TDB-379]